MRNGGWALTILLLAAGCQGGKDPAPGDTASSPDSMLVSGPDASEAPSEAPSEPPAAGRSVKAANAQYDFAYSYPDAVGAIPQLRKLFDEQLASERHDLESSASTDQEDGRKSGIPFDQHIYHAQWDVVADLPGWLSLSAQLYTYSEGAHGMPSFEAMLWDRRAETIRKPVDLFTSADALRNAIQQPFCNALDKEREQRRGEPVQRDGDEFNECIDPIGETLILGSSNHQTFDRIGILVPPYDAGPYAEGSYDITVPVTDKVMALLKPQYRSSFSVAGR